MDFFLRNKRAIVCGSTQGIGRAIAEKFAEYGASLILIARDESKLKETIQILQKDESQTHEYIVADFSDPTNLKIQLDEYMKKGYPVHILVNNTGGPPGGQLIDADISNFESALKMHLYCNHILTQTVVEGMKSEQYGRIINIISTSVKQPIPGLGVSNTTRGAVANWSKTLAGELAPFGITVNNILPGFIQTQRLLSLIKSRAEKQSINEDIVAKNMKSSIPMLEFGLTDDIALGALYLASNAAKYVTGINLPIDGGRISGY
ncbi:MAG: SDR family oxidoreductase [Candidatus Heimdallarchaeota archaeon]|nr:SDR family oxidoreductase [Candidatus Heimdallarchaeota archaeon]MDH5645894.1 SDR family oxidoreductase [Candidatus Heimdallarchaeota archaeon]